MHETADEGWKAAIERGSGAPLDSMGESPDAFVDGLAALVAEEKERLKARLAGRSPVDSEDVTGTGRAVDELRFEVSELRGRIESLQASVDALLHGPDDEG